MSPIVYIWWLLHRILLTITMIQPGMSAEKSSPNLLGREFATGGHTVDSIISIEFLNGIFEQNVETFSNVFLKRRRSRV